MSDPRWNEEGKAWLAERPAPIREKAEAYPPWQGYRVIPTGQVARILAYEEGEDGSCTTCRVQAWYEEFPLPVGVYGMPFTDLEPLPPDHRPPAGAFSPLTDKP